MRIGLLVQMRCAEFVQFLDNLGNAYFKAQSPPLNERVVQLIDHCLPSLLDMYETEDHK